MKNLNILIADDQASIRYTLRDILVKKGHNVTAVENGYKAVEVIKHKSFDFCFLDIKMPGIDGFKVLRIIKNYSPRTNIILMTAYSSITTTQKAMEEGCYALVEKPFNCLKILNYIEK
jgi:DNA-binding NtrC family response regulator